MKITKLVAVIIILVGFLTTACQLKAQTTYPPGGGIHGTVLGYDMYDQLTPLSWATVTAEIDGVVVAQANSQEGTYEMFVPGGDILLIVQSPGYINQTVHVYVSPGSSTTYNFTLDRSNKPIPEYPNEASIIFAAIALLTTLIMLRRRPSAKI